MQEQKIEGLCPDCLSDNLSTVFSETDMVCCPSCEWSGSKRALLNLSGDDVSLSTGNVREFFDFLAMHIAPQIGVQILERGFIPRIDEKVDREMLTIMLRNITKGVIQTIMRERSRFLSIKNSVISN